MSSEISDYYPLIMALLFVAAALWLTAMFWRNEGRLEGRAEILREQRHAEGERL